LNNDCVPTFSYCDIQGCGGSGDNWDPNFGEDGGENINSDPCFVNVNNPDGNDGFFFSWDDGLRLTINSPCIDAADGDVAPSIDILGMGRVDIAGVNNTGVSEPNYTDIGAYEFITGIHNITKDLYYLTIQEAINNASNGDTIEVNEGTYYENIDFKGKAIILTSTDPNDSDVVDTTIIDANGSGNVISFDSNEGLDSVITGFTIKNAGSHGIYCEYSSPTITNCTIYESGDYSYGIFSNGGSLNINGCIIRNNHGGIYCNLASTVITNCSIINNYYGIHGIEGLSVMNCIIWDNVDDLYGGLAIYSCIGDEDSGVGNFTIDPCFVGVDSNDFHLDVNSMCIDAGAPWSDYSNELSPDGNRINIGAYGNTPEATETTDTDGDGISDNWELHYWPGHDPNQHNPEDDPEGDGFSNWIEYLFGYNPTQSTPSSMELAAGISTFRFDPTNNETVTVTYLVNMTANVDVNFTNTDTDDTVYTISQTATAGDVNEAIWDGKDINGEIVEDGFYGILVNANDGDGNEASCELPTVELYYVHDISNLRCNPYRIVPLNNEVSKIAYELSCDENIAIEVYDPCGVLFTTLVDAELQTQGSHEVIWYGKDRPPTDPNSRYIAIEGDYLVRVKFVGMREKEEATIKAYK